MAEMESLLARQPTEGVKPVRRDYAKLRKKFSQLFNAQQRYVNKWKQLRDYQLPFIGQFDGEEDQSEPYNGKILNPVAWESCQIFASGVMSGLTPPSRKWFKLTMENIDVAANSQVAELLDEREEILYAVLAKSNFYSVVHQVYMELTMGQAPMGIFADSESGVRFTSYPIGTYAISTNSKEIVNIFGRKYKMTVDQIVEQFGYENCPDNIKNIYDNGNSLQQSFTVNWLVEPNKDRKDKLGRRNMPYSSIYWVEGSNSDEVLYHGGFEEWPIPIARHTSMDLNGYGKGAAWFAQPDSQMLQKLEFDYLTAVELGVKPPMQAPSDVISTVNLYPGGITEIEGQHKVEPMFAVQSNLQDIQNKIAVTEDSIKRAYSADLFLMLDQIDKGQMTAREVMERTQEKLQQLGPVVERLLSEFLNPIIERVYSVLDRAGVFPPVDDEDLLDQLNGQEVKIEYISPLAQAQKMSSLVNIEQYFAFIMSLAQANPNIVNKFNFEEAANTYGVNLGVPAKIIRSDDEYQEILAQQAQAQAEQEQQMQLMQAAQLAPQMASAAKQATDAANDGNPALQQWLGMDGV